MQKQQPRPWFPRAFCCTPLPALFLALLKLDILSTPAGLQMRKEENGKSVCVGGRERGGLSNECDFQLRLLTKSPSALERPVIFPFLYLQEIKGLLLHNGLAELPSTLLDKANCVEVHAPCMLLRSFEGSKWQAMESGFSPVFLKSA